MAKDSDVFVDIRNLLNNKCLYCDGKGIINDFEICPKCDGAGVLEEKETLKEVTKWNKITGKRN